MRPNVPLKNAAAASWCQKISATKYGRWRYLFAQQIPLETALNAGTKTFAELAGKLVTK